MVLRKYCKAYRSILEERLQLNVRLLAARCLEKKSRVQKLGHDRRKKLCKIYFRILKVFSVSTKVCLLFAKPSFVL